MGTPALVGKSHSSMLPAFSWTPWLTVRLPARKAPQDDGRRRLEAVADRARLDHGVVGELAIDDIVGRIERIAQGMVAGLDDAARVPRLLQDGQREVAVVQLVAAVEQVEGVHRVVERRRRPLVIVGDRRAQRQHFAGVVEAAHLQLGDLVHRAVGGVGRHGRVRAHRHEGLVGGVGSGRLRHAADDRHAVVLGGERVLQVLPGVDVVGGPEAADRLGGIGAGIDRVLAGDRDRRAVDLLDPDGRGVAAPHPELDAEVGVVGAVELVDLLDRAVDERRVERVLASVCSCAQVTFSTISLKLVAYCASSNGLKAGVARL